MPGYCTLTATTRPSCSTARCTCASEAAATGCGVELAEDGLEGLTELALRRRGGSTREGLRRHLVLQRREHVDVLVRDDVGTAAEELRRLDQQPLVASRRCRRSAWRSSGGGGAAPLRPTRARAASAGGRSACSRRRCAPASVPTSRKRRRARLREGLAVTTRPFVEVISIYRNTPCRNGDGHVHLVTTPRPSARRYANAIGR